MIRPLKCQCIVSRHLLITWHVPDTAETFRCSSSSLENPKVDNSYKICWMPQFVVRSGCCGRLAGEASVCLGKSGKGSQRKCWLSRLGEDEKKHIRQTGKEGRSRERKQQVQNSEVGEQGTYGEYFCCF